MRRAYILGSVVLGLVLTSLQPADYCRVVTSAYSFQHYFRDLKQADETLTPLQRLVFSLVLANGQPRPAVRNHS
jgi:hypothetical protein